MNVEPLHAEPGEDELHAYVDGRLDPARRAQIETWLQANPLRAERVRGWKLDAERLRAQHAHPEAWAANPALEPGRLRQRLRARRRQHLGLAASLLLTLGLGNGMGWHARDRMLSPSSSSSHPPMADAVAAYRQFVSVDSPPMEFDASRSDDLQRWLQRHFGDEGRVPDLHAAGYRLLGGRLLSTEQGAAAMLVYQDASGARVGFYLRPRAQWLGRGQRRDGGLLAQYWSQHDASFAVVSVAGDAAALRLPGLLQNG